MVKYYKTPNSVSPNIKEYDVIIDVVSVMSPVDSSSLLWCCKDEINEFKKEIGGITVVEKYGKKWIALHCAYEESGGSTIRFKEKSAWQGDTSKDRITYLKSSLLKVMKHLKESSKVFSSVLFSGIYKPTSKKHLSDIVYFIENIEEHLPENVDWTIHHKLQRRFKKNNKVKTVKQVDNVLY